MSFFKKLTKDFEDLKVSLTDDKKDKPQEQQHHQPPPQQHHGERAFHPEPQYGGGQSQYSYPPPAQPQSSGPDPRYGGGDAPYASPPPAPSAAPPMAAPSVPPGWIAQWDARYQRWFYVDPASGRSQWEHPAPPGQDNRAFGTGAPSHGGSHGGYGDSHGAGYGGHGDSHGHHDPYGSHGEKKKSGSSGMLLGAAGGLAVGAVGGALVANALDDSDDEHHHHAAAPSGYYGHAPSDPYGAPPGVLPTHDADGDSVSSGDREDVQEAREEYEEALADAHDSDASSSDHERLQEAREEYYEEYEETYDD